MTEKGKIAHRLNVQISSVECFNRVVQRSIAAIVNDKRWTASHYVYY